MEKREQDAPLLKRLPHHKFWGIFVAAFLLLCIICLTGLWSLVSSFNLIAPRVFVEGIDVGGKNADQARALLANHAGIMIDIPVELSLGDVVVSTSSATLGMRYDLDGAIEQALSVGRGGSGFDNVVAVVDSMLVGTHLPMGVMYDQVLVKNWAQNIANQYDAKGEVARVELVTPGNIASLSIKPGTIDRTVDVEALAASITNQRTLPPQRVAIPVTQRLPLSTEEQQQVKSRAEKVVGKSLSFAVDDQEYALNDKKIVSLFSLPTGYKSDEIDKEVAGWKEKVNREPQEPSIKIEGTKDAPKVTAFTPPLYGRTIDTTQAAQIVTTKLNDLENPSPLLASIPPDESPTQIPITRVDPKNSLASLNDLGINERIGFAESTYFHSIPNRVYNVALTASRLNYTLVAPGATFSFNNAIGEVSGATGYKSAYIIQAGRTVLGDGGGVCQDSTTTFRAAMNAGLPIVSRRGHSYRVSYYEQNSPPGVDATVISPSVDFKFQNDTPGYVLITTKADSANYHLEVEMWGTSDGRKSELSEFKLWDQVPPRATVYQEDPSLPVGTTKQVDWSAPGAKASFRYTVTRGDKVTIDETYKTVYQPWAAVYLVGTGPR